MATSYAGSAGFDLPAIDYTLTKAIDIPGAIDKGMKLGSNLLDLPNEGRARQIQGQQQKAVMDGKLEFMGAKVDKAGGVTGDYSDPALAQSERQLGGLKGQNILNQMSNRDLNTGSQIGLRGIQGDVAQQRAGEYGQTQQHTRATTGWDITGRKGYTPEQLPNAFDQVQPQDDFDKAVLGLSKGFPGVGSDQNVPGVLPPRQPGATTQPQTPQQPAPTQTPPPMKADDGSFYEYEEI